MEFKAKSFVANKTSLEQQAFDAIVYAQSITDSDKRVELIVRGYEGKRSLSANAQQHVWYKAISEHTGEDLKTVELRMKRDHGLPILLADEKDGPLTDWILKKLRFYHRSDAGQLRIMSGIAVTSTFSPKQHSAFRDSMQVFWNAQGLNIDYLT